MQAASAGEFGCSMSMESFQVEARSYCQMCSASRVFGLVSSTHNAAAALKVAYDEMSESCFVRFGNFCIPPNCAV